MRHMKPTDGTGKKPYFVQSLDRAMDILECFGYGSRELDLASITKKTALNRTTARRLISNLSSRGYLAYDPETKRYRLGLKLFELGGIVLSSISLHKVAAPHLTALRDKTRRTVFLGIAEGDRLVYLDTREAKGFFRFASNVGTIRPLHYGMLGIILMAYMPRKKQEELLDAQPLKQYTSYSITDRDEFSLILARARDNGYFVGREHVTEGFGGIAAPVRDHTRKVVASLGLAVPIEVLDDPARKEDLIGEVTGTANAISRDLGYLRV